jgi:hypothetical protein
VYEEQVLFMTMLSAEGGSTDDQPQVLAAIASLLGFLVVLPPICSAFLALFWPHFFQLDFMTFIKA